MPLPSLNEHGLLPPGIHECTVAEIAEVFGRFRRSDKRMKLLDRLRLFLTEAWKVDDGLEVLVNGSFIMGKVDEPSDIDVVIILPSNWEFAAELSPFKYNVLSKRMVRRMYRFDVLVGVAGEQSEADAVMFFSDVNPKWCEPLGIPVGTQKGLIRVRR